MAKTEKYEDIYSEELKKVFRFRIVKGECIPDENSPIVGTIYYPLLTKEETERRLKNLSDVMSNILGYECEVYYRKPDEDVI